MIQLKAAFDLLMEDPVVQVVQVNCHLQPLREQLNVNEHGSESHDPQMFIPRSIYHICKVLQYSSFRRSRKIMSNQRYQLFLSNEFVMQSSSNKPVSKFKLLDIPKVFDGNLC